MEGVLLPINLDSLLHQRSVESERVEYKRSWNPEAVLHSICAFANDFHNLGGGYAVVGVEEKNGRPVLPQAGLLPEQIDRIQKELLNLGNAAIQPPCHPLTAVYEVQGRLILILWVPGGETRPYKARIRLGEKNTGWAYYLRKHTSTVQARGEDERELLSLAATVPYDDRCNQGAGLADLSPLLMREHLQEIGSELADAAATMNTEELDLTEGRSTGIPKILRVMRANGSPRPVFESDEDRSSFLVRLPVHPGFLPADTPEVTPEVMRLLEGLNGEMSRAELMRILNLKDEKHFREHYLQRAISQGLIEMTIPDKPKSSLQKYRLTVKGKARLRGRGSSISDVVAETTSEVQPRKKP